MCSSRLPFRSPRSFRAQPPTQLLLARLAKSPCQRSEVHKQTRKRVTASEMCASSSQVVQEEKQVLHKLGPLAHLHPLRLNTSCYVKDAVEIPVSSFHGGTVRLP